MNQSPGCDAPMIMLVDDNTETSDTLTEWLSCHGHVVLCATNGYEALRLLASSHDRPTLILLDLMMPVLDGWGFLDERDKDPLLADIPVVIISGCRGVAQKAREAGAVAFVPKPVDAHLLLRVVEHFEELN